MVLKAFDVIRAFPSLYAMENHCKFRLQPFHEKNTQSTDARIFCVAL